MLIWIISDGNFSNLWENGKREQVYFVHNNMKHWGKKVEKPSTEKHDISITRLKCKMKSENKWMCKKNTTEMS